MKIHLLTFLFVGASVVAAPPDFWPEIDSYGRIIKNAKVTRVKPEGLQILHDAGMETVPWRYLPPEVKRHYQTEETIGGAERVAAAEAEAKHNNMQAAKVTALEKETARLAPLTGLPVDKVRWAVFWHEWCMLNPKGGRVNNGQEWLTVSQADRDETLRQSLLIINHRPGKDAQTEPQQHATAQASRQQNVGAGASSSLIESRIDGEFEGWEGETVVRLINGQVWQQSDFRFLYAYKYLPTVIIYQTSGGWEMKVDGMEPVCVQQLK